MIKYSYRDIESVSNNLNTELPTDVINIINFIAHKVGAPSYKKTPNFKKKNVDKITGDDWAAIRNFKKTILEKNTSGIAVCLDELRTLLNKITDKSYDTIESEIFKKIENAKDNFKYEEFMKIGKLIFEIGSLNKYCSALYAKLYKNLISQYEVFTEISNKNFDIYLNVFDNIRVVNAEDDYNLYCDCNKDNENRKSLSLFYVNLMKENVFDIDKIFKIILILIKKVETYIEEENKKNTVEEVVNNLLVFISNTFEEIKTHDDFNIIENHILKISNGKKSDYKSLTSKIKFKYMDLLELLED
tara:strand:- start:694 stop:1599 length:906 start_codon:yes stop_codon:yes gene_type:complete